jgi:hypothetical protein
MIAPTALRLCVGTSLQYSFDLQFLCCPCFLLQGFDLSRTVLVDNDDYKAADGEHENMLHVPHWEQTPGEDDRPYYQPRPVVKGMVGMHVLGVWHRHCAATISRMGLTALCWRLAVR